MHTLATALRDLRVQRGLTQAQLAQASQLSLSAINDIETGRRKKTYHSTLAALTRALRREKRFSTDEVQFWCEVTGLDPRAVNAEDSDPQASLESLGLPRNAPIPDEVLVALAQLLTVADPHYVVKILHTAFAVSLRSPMPTAPPQTKPDLPPPVIAPDGVKVYHPPAQPTARTKPPRQGRVL